MQFEQYLDREIVQLARVLNAHDQRSKSTLAGWGHRIGSTHVQRAEDCVQANAKLSLASIHFATSSCARFRQWVGNTYCSFGGIRFRPYSQKSRNTIESCNDIVSTTNQVQARIARTIRWHHFLRCCPNLCQIWSNCLVCVDSAKYSSD